MLIAVDYEYLSTVAFDMLVFESSHQDNQIHLLGFSFSRFSNSFY